MLSTKAIDIGDVIVRPSPYWLNYSDGAHLVLRTEALQFVEQLAAMCRLALTLPGGQLMTFDTWAIGRSQAQVDAMRDSLRLIAKSRGLSTFGNDWQDALHE